MKLRIWDRILAALTGLVLIAVAVCGLLWCFGGGELDRYLSDITEGWLRWAAVAVCVVLILLGLHGLSLLCRRRKDKGFVMQRTEYGDMSISMKALENMVKKCVEAHPELKVSHTKIYRVRSGISVEIRILLMSGVNIPLAVNALQKQIKQYITSCSGVDVYEVRVKVETDIARLAPPAEVPALEEASPLQMEQLCQHKEEPQIYTEKAAQAETVEELPAVQEAPAEPAAEPETLAVQEEKPLQEPETVETAEDEIAVAETAEEEAQA